MIHWTYYVTVGFSSALFVVLVAFFLSKPFFNLATSAIGQIDIIVNSVLDDRTKDRLLLKNLKVLNQ